MPRPEGRRFLVMARQLTMPKAVSSLPSVQRLYISDNEEERKRKGTWSSAATRIVLAKNARRAVAVDTITAELS
jgi:hypothetical protein